MVRHRGNQISPKTIDPHAPFKITGPFYWPYEFQALVQADARCAPCPAWVIGGMVAPLRHDYGDTHAG